MSNLTVGSPLNFFISIVLGSIGLASATTIISAIIAKANSRNALFPALSFPALLPLIIIGIESTVMSFDGDPFSKIAGNYQLMLAYSGAMITVSFLLFELVWHD
jgi:heme exporter protein B